MPAGCTDLDFDLDNGCGYCVHCQAFIENTEPGSDDLCCASCALDDARGEDAWLISRLNYN